MYLPKIIYESLPATYVAAGLGSFAGVPQAWISGILFILAGVLVHYTRKHHRIKAKRNLGRRNYGYNIDR